MINHPCTSKKEASFALEITIFALFSALMLHLVPFVLILLSVEDEPEREFVEFEFIEMDDAVSAGNTRDTNKNFSSPSKNEKKNKDDNLEVNNTETNSETSKMLQDMMKLKDKDGWKYRLAQLEVDAKKRHLKHRNFEEDIYSFGKIQLKHNRKRRGKCLNEEEFKALRLKNTRSAGRLEFLLPSGIFPAHFLDSVVELGRSFKKGILKMNILLPAKLLPLDVRLDEKRSLAIGHPEKHCPVTIKFKKNLFPVSFSPIPLWIKNKKGVPELHFVTVSLALNADISISARSKKTRLLLKTLPKTLLHRKKKELSRILARQYAFFKSLRRLFNN